jgi:hypothetical protein
MSMDDEFRDEKLRQQVSVWVQEYEELCAHIRTFTESDLCAWFVVQAWIDWKRIGRIRSKRKRKGDRPISEAQLKELASQGMESLADLSRNEAQVLIDGLTPIGPDVGAEEVEGGWY